MKSKKPSEKSKSQTTLCVKCFNKIETNSLRFLGKNPQFLCKNCLNERKPKFEKFKVLGVDAFSIYEYDENFKGSLFTLKGCGDIELAKTFLNPYEREIRLFFNDYILVPAPSFHEDDEERGFNHVEEIFKPLNLKIIKAIFKKEKIKQSDLSGLERQNVINNMEVKTNYDFTNKKILIVDDVFTTGSTVKAMIILLKKFKPKKIKVLVVARTTLEEKHK